ncbi:MAG: hypothetical protein ACTSRX_06735 [Promethearchaeota archaeon]
MSDGQKFKIFRQVIKKPSKKQTFHPKALFKVRFIVENMSMKQNIRFSRFPIPFFIGLPGFRSKLWTFSEETKYFQGIYEWDTIKHAEKYSTSFAMKFMTRRSKPGSVNSSILLNKPENFLKFENI